MKRIALEGIMGSHIEDFTDRVVGHPDFRSTTTVTPTPSPFGDFKSWVSDLTIAMKCWVKTEDVVFHERCLWSLGAYVAAYPMKTEVKKQEGHLFIEMVNATCEASVPPDLILLFDISPERARQRLRKQGSVLKTLNVQFFDDMSKNLREWSNEMGALHKVDTIIIAPPRNDIELDEWFSNALEEVKSRL